MASANVELAARIVDAFNGRDVDTFSGLITDDFVWVTRTVTSSELTQYRGQEGLRQFFEDTELFWEKIESRVDEIRDVGDRAVVLGELFWHGRRRSLEVAGPFGSVLYFENGKLKRIETYRSASEALASLGLGE
ncbi:MAG: nuclear transport factor 2 family protein [Solirubrobacteraceae bacterium]|jgi:ketosteroid isomerase-like protein